MQINGTVESIIFRNSENGYSVLTVMDEKTNEIVTVTGKFPMISVGELVCIEGEVKNNAKYGNQFVATKMDIIRPTTTAGIERYLSSGLINGVGPITAKNIVEKYGLDTLDILELNPILLAKVKGVSNKKAEAIGLAYSEIKDMQNAVMFLQSYDISTNLAVKIFNEYKNKTIELVKQNPYRLVEDIDGIGFLTADKIAFHMGVDLDSMFRLRAGALHLLKDNSDKSGNTLMSQQLLKTQLETLLKINFENSNMFDKLLSNLLIDGVVKTFSLYDVECIMLSKYYYIERSVATKLSILNQNQSSSLDLSKEIEHYCLINKLILDKEQIEAITSAVNNGVSIITGGPGTGKTTIIKCIISLLKSMNYSVKLMAPTGRASKRLEEATNTEASTIHRALDLMPSGKSSGYYYSFDENNPLPADVVIVDEVSMVDISLMNSLLKALKKTTKLILVGDKDQLPSVGAGNVLGDIISSNTIKCCYLNKIYRQDSGSLIIVNAHKINNGETPIFDNTSDDFFYEQSDDYSSMSTIITELVNSRITAKFGIPSQKIQVLSPMKAGLCGVNSLNEKLQNKLNPSKIYKNEISQFSTTFRVGDKVMQTSNNYNKEWQKISGHHSEFGTGVFNGDIGYIIQIDRGSKETTVLFEDDRQAIYSLADINELTLSYAITIHKSQGCEFDAVIIPLVGGSPQILTRNLLYTAVTRAKKIVILIGQKKNLFMMIKNNRTNSRYCLLKQFLIDINNQSSSIDI